MCCYGKGCFLCVVRVREAAVRIQEIVRSFDKGVC